VALIAGVEFHFDIDFSELDLQETENYLKSIVSKYSDLIYDQRTEVHVKLEDGSLKVKLAIVGAIYIAIGQYGSFRSGIDYLIKDAKSIKELTTSEIVRKGLNESDILDSKRMHCAPDKIRRVLLAIDRLESHKNLSKDDARKQLSKIKTSVRNICDNISNEDAGLFASSISKKYWPKDREIPYYVERYKILAREEDIVQYPVVSLESRRVNKALQRTSH
jgi:hypothetical protein